MTGYYLNDANPKDNSFGESSVDHNRYRGEWQHKQYLTNDVTVTVDINKLSDSDVIEDFFPDEFRGNREPGSVADITKRGPDYTLSFLTAPQFNEFFAGVERLPETKLAVDRNRLGNTPFFYEGESSVGQYHNVPVTQMCWAALQIRILLEMPFAPTLFTKSSCRRCWEGWLSVIPRAGIRGDYYSQDTRRRVRGGRCNPRGL